MTRDLTVRLHAIADDGLPDMDNLTARVAFIFDGCVVSGWPLPNGFWEADSDVGRPAKFSGVTHWLEFPEPIGRLVHHQ